MPEQYSGDDAEYDQLLFQEHSHSLPSDIQIAAKGARIRLDRAYAEAQEQSRRDFDLARDRAAGELEERRQAIDLDLLAKQIVAKREIADQETRAAADNALATRRIVVATWAAAIAAIMSAIGTFIQLWLATNSK